MAFSPGLQTWATREFVSFWKQFYNANKYPSEVYDRNLNLGAPLTETNVSELLAWKLGYASSPKEIRESAVAEWASVIDSKLDWLNEVRGVQEFDDSHFDFYIRKSLEAVEVINKRLVMGVFLLHIARPSDFPMVDQHVLRAWHFVSHCNILDPETSPENYKAYRTFFCNFCRKSQSSHREVDQALMTFGQFLQRFA